MMLGWPVILFLAVLADGYLVMHQMGYSRLAMALVFLWLLYSYVVLAYVRNSNLHFIAVQQCDFKGYVECMRFLEKFYVLKKGRLAQRLGATDAYLVSGDFDSAYKLLMDMRGEYNHLSVKSRILYDYFWCRFYGDLEDLNNFQICFKVYQDKWLSGQVMLGRDRALAESLMHELGLIDCMFRKDAVHVRSQLTNLYNSGNLRSRYEFVKYCYLMGKVEDMLGNLMIAKHWYAQTVSFGLSDYRSVRAARILQNLDAMEVPYAMNPPENNLYRDNPRVFRVRAGIGSIFVGFLIVIVVLMW